MFDADLAELYGVRTKSLNLAVRRNMGRFPNDFMFQLTQEEADSLRFQNETSKKDLGGTIGALRLATNGDFFLAGVGGFGRQKSPFRGF